MSRYFFHFSPPPGREFFFWPFWGKEKDGRRGNKRWKTLVMAVWNHSRKWLLSSEHWDLLNVFRDIQSVGDQELQLGVDDCFLRIIPQRVVRCAWICSRVSSHVWTTTKHPWTGSSRQGKRLTLQTKTKSRTTWHCRRTEGNLNTKQFDYVVLKLKKKVIEWLMEDHNIYCTKVTLHPPPIDTPLYIIVQVP
jgi:hypothetical protein